METIMDREKRIREFMEVYQRILTKNVTENPAMYTYGVDRIPDTVAKLTEGFIKSIYTVEINTPTFRLTCKEFKIRHTYKGMDAFFNS